MIIIQMRSKLALGRHQLATQRTLHFGGEMQPVFAMLSPLGFLQTSNLYLVVSPFGPQVGAKVVQNKANRDWESAILKTQKYRLQCSRLHDRPAIEKA